MAMVAIENEISIRSRHGLLRDMIPIYSLYQLIPNLMAVGLVLWLSYWLGRFSPFVIIIVMLGWVIQFLSRPSVIIVSKEQAAWLGTVLQAQGIYTQSGYDGRWRMPERPWWNRQPHHFIEFVPSNGVMVIAPRDVMESLRASLELVEERGELYFASENEPFVFEPPEPEPRLPWQMQVPAVVLGAACVLAFFWILFTSGPEGSIRWGLSASALFQGRFETIFLHMFAHGGTMHLVMNMTALAAVGAALTSRLGPVPLSWLRFWLLFLLSGVAGATLYLALHPAGAVPMVGASGGLYGLIGLLVRAPPNGESVLAVKSTRIRRIGWDLVKQNAFLFALLALMSWSSGSAGGLAWEAHLGGFLFGLFIGPTLLPRASNPALSKEPLAETVVRAD